MLSVITIFLLVLVVALWCWIMSGIGLQFPTAYTLLKESPEIDRRERIALWVILGSMVLFILLLLTAGIRIPAEIVLPCVAVLIWAVILWANRDL